MVRVPGACDGEGTFLEPIQALSVALATEIKKGENVLLGALASKSSRDGIAARGTEPRAWVLPPGTACRELTTCVIARARRARK